ncbi:MAG: SDR family NAD(P)-dependent oxidoreductase [Desulfobacterales bacterium]|nr:SDR family NAD(P)-dependent oxidoreductase [Desulfobacterales bacterium]
MPVAIIGMSCMFAGADDMKGYWRLLRQGEDAIAEVPKSHWSGADYYSKDPKTPDHVYCTRGGFLSPVDFDPTEFGMPPSTLEATDTAQLMGLMTAKFALEDAGYGNAGKNFDRTRASVILGVTGTQELVIPLSSRLGHPIWRKALDEAGVPREQAEDVVSRIGDAYVPWQENSFPGLLGNVVAGRIANRLDLGGTNCVVDAACASSFSALNLGMLELETGRSDLVLTGGVDALNDIFMHMCFSKTQVLSHSGDARPFSAEADGTVLGEGLGIVVLKRLDDALAAGDRIYAVIRGMGTSSDGKSQSIYAPCADGQISALSRAYDRARIDPSTVRLIEAHGTGTRVGDAVEFSALNRFFNSAGAPLQGCALGSVKSMIGHTKAAAGVAGLIKTALALHHKVLPPTLKIKNPDPELKIDESPFYLNAESRPWIADPNHPRRAGVSAFGFGGSNFHLVLEEHDSTKQAVAWDGSVEIAAWGEENPQVLSARIDRFVEAVADHGASSHLARLAFETRKAFSSEAPCRLVVILERGVDPVATLKAARKTLAEKPSDAPWQEAGAYYGTGPIPGDIAFLFPGQGSQYVGMGRDLACCFPELFQVLEAADAAISGPGRLTDRIFPKSRGDRKRKEVLETELRRTDMAQPAIGAISAGMLDILTRFGLSPRAAAGHSYGELTALLAAGRLSMHEFLTLSAVRGDCMARAGASGDCGAMLAVRAPLADIIGKIIPNLTDVVLANLNSPDQGVLSGPSDAIEKALAFCRENGFKAIKLPVAAAFHSTLVESARQPFADHLRSAALVPGRFPVYSDTSATPYPDDPDEARAVLADQMTHPVNFVGIVENLYASGVRTFIEVGPKAVLTALVRATLKDRPAIAAAMDGSGGRGSGLVDLARVLALLAAQGWPVKLNAWESQPSPERKPKMRISLTGSNYRSPRPHRAPAKPVFENTPSPRTEAPAEIEKPMTAPKAATPAPSSVERSDEPHCQQPVQPPGTEKNSSRPLEPNAQWMTGALYTVNEGLKSMQDLQVRTAQAHEKFLETQSRAGQTLAQMMQSIENMLSGAPIRPPMAAPIQSTVSSHLPPPTQPIPVSEPVANPTPAQSTPTEKGELAAVEASAPLTGEPGHPPILAILMATVSRLTGYPEEMLSTDMDMEADLGIDSIKRVEILSSLEEALPDLSAMSPETMSELKTLGQIVDHITGLTGVGPAPADSTKGHASRQNNGEKSTIEAALTAVVSELTGYPREMLSADMDMESDLGIDSIKRVEILSALEERLPNLPGVSPEQMADLKTLGQIVAFLSPETGSCSVPESPGHASPPAGTPSVMSHLVAVISRLTGYPEEMLSADMDMESDLGIDSIKRVEILSAMEERLPNLPGVSPEQMADLKTLGQIAACLSKEPLCPATVPSESAPAPAVEPSASPNHEPTAISRQEVVVTETPFPEGPAAVMEPGSTVLIFGEETPLANAMGDAIAAMGLEAMRVLPGFDDTDLPEAAGLIILADEILNAKALPMEAFRLARTIAPALSASAKKGHAFLATVTRLDGAFGFLGGDVDHPHTGALAGLAKTAALEWPGVRCLALDVSPQWEPEAVAQSVLMEILGNDTQCHVEIGLDGSRRLSLSLADVEANATGALPEPGHVVVVSGGARGVTAASALALANTAKPMMVLLGRSAPPEPEPAWLHELTEPAAIKRALMENGFADARPTPRQLEQAYGRILAGREIHQTLALLAATDAGGHYFQVDVRDAHAVKACLDRVRREIGPIRGVIHGAGVLCDRLIADKTVDQFADVFETKVTGLENLLAATADDPLTHLVIFSSVAARFGNTGQVDYAMANETMNKMALREAARRPDCRVRSINWGPWDGGMVSDGLKREFSRRGIGLIPLAAGAEAMVREMASVGPVEVIMGGRLDHDRQRVAPSTPDLKAAVAHQINLAGYPVLDHHRLQGRPVVPLALITEWMAHGALHDNPGLRLAGLDNLRLISGIKMGTDALTVHFMAGQTFRNNGHFHVPVEIHGQGNGQPRIHARAMALLEEFPAAAPEDIITEDVGLRPYSRSVQNAYDQVLFHGPHLHGIQEVLGCCGKGIRARIRTAPSPAEWIANPLRTRWIADPLVLDSAFQMAILWSDEIRGVRCLPSFIGAYRQYCRSFPRGSVEVALRVTCATDRKLTGDVTVTDNKGQIVAILTGFEAIMDPALANAFRPSCAA